MLDSISNVKEDRTAEDLLFQVLIDWGTDLTLPVQTETIANKTVHFVDENAIAACFDNGITEEFIKQLAEPPTLTSRLLQFGICQRQRQNLRRTNFQNDFTVNGTKNDLTVTLTAFMSQLE